MLRNTYEIELSSSKINTQKLTVDLTKGNNLELDAKLDYYKSKLVLTNLKKESRVFINNNDVTEKIADNSLDLEIGEYQLKVVTNDYKTTLKKIKIEKNSRTPVTLDYISSKIDYHDFYNASYALFGVGIPTFCVGATLLTIGTLGYCIEEYIVYPKQDALAYTLPFVVSQKTAFLALMGVGIGLSSCGLIMIIIGIPLYYFAKKIENSDVSMLLDSDKSNFVVGLKLKL